MNYRKEVLKTAPNLLSPKGRETALNLGALGLAGETGEVVELIKKELFHQNKPFTRERMIEELGDVRWYFELICYAIGADMEEIEKANIEKLRKRYPAEFEKAEK